MLLRPVQNPCIAATDSFLSRDDVGNEARVPKSLVLKIKKAAR